MRATFVHTADNHLGFEQYGEKERFNDFARAFISVVDDAIERHADCFLIAGDLFNKRAIDALTLMQAQAALKKLHDAGIPAIGIEGNHDRSYYRDGVSWLQFLCWEGLLILLNPMVEHGVPQLTPWDKGSMRGAYVDLKDGKLRIYGLPWYGASTARVMEAFARELAAARADEEAAGVEYRVLLMHTGVEGIVPQLHGLPTRAQFEPLRGLVDYIGLGHVHKNYDIDNWIYNPGSTETWGAEESQWDRGYYVVSVETDVPEGERRHTTEHPINPRRPFVRLSFGADGIADPTAFYDTFERFCRNKSREYGMTGTPTEDMAPVVDVQLTGVLSFDSGSLERPRLEEMLKTAFSALIVRVHDATHDVDYTPTGEEEGDMRDRSTRLLLEVRVLQDLIARDSRYTEKAPQWARVLAQMKEMALTGEEPAHIAQRLREARTELLQ